MEKSYHLREPEGYFAGSDGMEEFRKLMRCLENAVVQEVVPGARNCDKKATVRQ